MGVSKTFKRNVLFQAVSSIIFIGVWLCKLGSRRPHPPYSSRPSSSYQFKFKGTPTFHGMGGMAWVVAQTYPIKIAIHASRRGLRDHVNLPNATLFDSYVEYVERPPSKAPVFHHGNIQSC